MPATPRPTPPEAGAAAGAPTAVAAAAAVALSFDVAAAGRVSALWQRPAGAWLACALAHGAGAGMAHAFMAAFADGLAARGIAVLRYQFPFMEAGRARVDPPAVAHATVRAAVTELERLAPELPRVAAGKSFGGRMSSQADALVPLPGVRGLLFIGFPLHPAGRPGVERAAHLDAVERPMLFLQGTRDELADALLMARTADGLGPRATVHWVPGADHAFHVRPAPRGEGAATDRRALEAMLDAVAAWARPLAA